MFTHNHMEAINLFDMPIEVAFEYKQSRAKSGTVEMVTITDIKIYRNVPITGGGYRLETLQDVELLFSQKEIAIWEKEICDIDRSLELTNPYHDTATIVA